MLFFMFLMHHVKPFGLDLSMKYAIQINLPCHMSIKSRHQILSLLFAHRNVNHFQLM